MSGFSYEKITNNEGVHFRVRDPQDNRVATCYLEENARMVAGALNRDCPPTLPQSESTESSERIAACLHACEGLSTLDLKANAKGWVSEVVTAAAGVENDLEHYRRIVRRQDHGEAYDTMRRVNLDLSARLAKFEGTESAELSINALAPGERKPGEIAGPLNDTRPLAGQRDRASQEQAQPVEGTIPSSDDPPFHCEAWGRRTWKCNSQCDGCFRKQYGARLLRAERLLREFITTCEVHGVTSKKFFDLWSDAEAARVYFREVHEIIAQSATGSIKP